MLNSHMLVNIIKYSKPIDFIVSLIILNMLNMSFI